MSSFQPSCILVTGGAGFIGSNFIRWALAKDANVRIINYDLLTYAGNLESLDDVAQAHGPTVNGRYYFVHGDIKDYPLLAATLRGDGRETSIEAPRPAPPVYAAV